MFSWPSNSTFSFFPAKQGCQATGLLMSWQLRMSLGGPEDRGSGLPRGWEQTASPVPCKAGLGNNYHCFLPKVVLKVGA